MATANQSIIIALATTSDFFSAEDFTAVEAGGKAPAGALAMEEVVTTPQSSGSSKCLPFCPTAAMAPRGGAVVRPKVGRVQSIPNILGRIGWVVAKGQHRGQELVNCWCIAVLCFYHRTFGHCFSCFYIN